MIPDLLGLLCGIQVDSETEQVLETRYFTSAAPRLTCPEHFSYAICSVRVVTS
jgi:hypothetical protein